MAENLDLSVGNVKQLQLLIEQEKTDLARQIHDDLGAHLIATSMDLAFLKRRLSSDPVALDKIERATSSLNAAVDMMRRVTEELHPTLLDNVGLFAALRRQISQIRQRTSITCVDHLPDAEIRLRATTAITLFRVGQEALVVAENHPHATHIDFTVTLENATLSVRMSVDGDSSLPENDSRGQVAMEFLRHRVEAMNGAVTLSSLSGGGLRLAVEVCLDAVSTSATQSVRVLEIRVPDVK